MAKLSESGILGEVSGQVGGLIISRLHKKKVIKNKGKKKNNHTEPKQRTERLFGELPKVWKSMKRQEKKSWYELLNSGHVFRGSKGKHINDASILFKSLNRNLQEAEEPLLIVAPYDPIFPHLPLDIKYEIIINKKGTNIKLNKTEAINQDVKLILYATPILTNASDKVDKKLFRKIGILDSSFKSGSSLNEMYLKVFEKMPEEGDEISIQHKAVQRNLGTVSLPIHYIVAAKRQLKTQKNPKRNQ